MNETADYRVYAYIKSRSIARLFTKMAMAVYAHKLSVRVPFFPNPSNI
jgi:hypothetical protein